MTTRDTVLAELKQNVDVPKSKQKVVLKSNTPLSLKRRLYVIEPAMTYASDTWTLAKVLEGCLAADQRTMERAMIGVTCQDPTTNEWAKSRTKVPDDISIMKTSK